VSILDNAVGFLEAMDGGDVTIVAMLAWILTAVVLSGLSVQTGTLTFTKPTTWTDRAAASSMRVAEFVVPKASGDSEDAEVIVYYFGGGGGSVDANLQRWTTQFQSTKDPVRTTATVNGLKLTSLDVSGTYVAETRPGSAEHYNKPGYRMRATVIETPKGPYFIKLTGPAKTVDSAGAAFDQFLRSLAFK
jgi:hypothetical protein